MNSAELRALAEEGPNKVLRGNICVAVQMRDAILELAAIKDAAGRGVTDEMIDVAHKAVADFQAENFGIDIVEHRKALMRAVLEAVAPMLLVREVSGDEIVTCHGISKDGHKIVGTYSAQAICNMGQERMLRSCQNSGASFLGRTQND